MVRTRNADRKLYRIDLIQCTLTWDDRVCKTLATRSKTRPEAHGVVARRRRETVSGYQNVRQQLEAD